MCTFKWMLLPFCVTTATASGASRRKQGCQVTVQGHHWMLLVADMASRSVAVLNSITGVPSYTLAGNHVIELFRSVDQIQII